MYLRLKHFIFFFLVFILMASFFRSVNVIGSTKYVDDIYSVKTTKNVKYGEAVGYTGKNETLLLDIYEPNDNGTDKRPLIVFVHGGSFVAGDKSVYSDNATNLAKKGYLASSINYRLDSTHPPYNPSSPDINKVITSSKEDTLKAIGWFIENSDKYKIDTSKIFVGGSSAGAVTALYTAFSEDANSKKVKAVYSIAGAVLPDGLELIDSEDPPTIMFNGTVDTIVPYDMAKQTIAKLESEKVTAKLVSYQGSGHSIISQKNADIHKNLVQFLLPYATVNTPSVTATPTLNPTSNLTPSPSISPSIIVTIMPTPTGLINQTPTMGPTLTLTPTPTATPLTVQELLKNYLFGDKKADLNNDGIINGFDFFELYEKTNR